VIGFHGSGSNISQPTAPNSIPREGPEPGQGTTGQRQPRRSLRACAQADRRTRGLPHRAASAARLHHVHRPALLACL